MLYDLCRAHKLVHSQPFLDYLYEFWHLLSALYSDMRKIFYMGAPQDITVHSSFRILNTVHSSWRRNENCVELWKERSLLKKKLLQWKFFFKSLSEVVRTNFSADFWTFHNFCTHFGDYGAIWRRNENYIALLKGRSLLKKNCWKLRQNWSINRDVMIGRTMHPVERRAHAIGAWQKKYRNTTFSHLQPARVIRSSPNFAWR